jgi:hypothetical protein
MIGDLSEPPPTASKTSQYFSSDHSYTNSKRRKHPCTGSEYLLLNEYPDEHDEMDTKLFYLKEINDYIGKGRLQKFLSSDDIHSYKYHSRLMI